MQRQDQVAYCLDNIIWTDHIVLLGVNGVKMDRKCYIKTTDT